MSFQLIFLKRTSQIVALSCVALICAGARAEKIKSLKPQGYVNDFAGVLSASAKDKLTVLCGEVDHSAGAQIAVVTVHSLEGEPAEQYTFELASQWGVGPKQSSRGVMILIAPDEHKYYTAVGYGLEPILPDGKVGGFGREAVPLLRQNDYDGAILLMTQRVAAVIAADKGVTLTSLNGVQPPPQGNGSATSGNVQLGWLVPLIFLIVIVVIIASLLRRGGPSTRGGSGGGIPWWLWFVLGNMSGGGRGGSSWGGGFGGGGGGGGFGGFGGGGFGGGGAGGSW